MVVVALYDRYPLCDSLETPFSPSCPSVIKVRMDARVPGCVSLKMKHFDSSWETSLFV